MGCRLWGHTESDTTEVTAAAAVFHSRRKQQSTPVFLPGKSHGQRSFTAAVHGVTKGSDRTQRLNNIKRYAAAAAAASLQSCATLCDPIDGSPPGSPVPGILQARTLEWVAISFSDA